MSTRLGHIAWILGQTLVWMFLFWGCHVACEILVPWPGIELVPPAMKRIRSNHCTTRKFPLDVSWGCFWMRFTLKIWVKQIALHNVVGPHPMHWRTTSNKRLTSAEMEGIQWQITLGPELLWSAGALTGLCSRGLGPGPFPTVSSSGQDEVKTEEDLVDFGFASLYTPRGWSCSLSTVQRHEPPSIVHQALDQI